MSRSALLLLGGLCAVLSAGLIAAAVMARQPDFLGPDLARFGPYAGVLFSVGAGIMVVLAAVCLGIGMGHWRHPRRVPTEAERRHEGVRP